MWRRFWSTAHCAVSAPQNPIAMDGPALRRWRATSSGRKTPRVSATFDQVAQEFLEQREANPDVAKRTSDTNRTHINKVSSFIGNDPIRSKTPDDIQNLLNDLRNPDHPLNNGKGASGTYAEKVYATLKQIFDFALKRGYVKENVVKSDEVAAPQRDTAFNRLGSKKTSYVGQRSILYATAETQSISSRQPMSDGGDRTDVDLEYPTLPPYTP